MIDLIFLYTSGPALTIGTIEVNVKAVKNMAATKNLVLREVIMIDPSYGCALMINNFARRSVVYRQCLPEITVFCRALLS